MPYPSVNIGFVAAFSALRSLAFVADAPKEPFFDLVFPLLAWLERLPFPRSVIFPACLATGIP